MRPATYGSGIKPLEFAAMTVQQIVQWIEAFNETALSKTKEQAVLLDGQAMQIISGVGGMLDKKIKYLTLEKQYPELFGKKVDTSKLTPEQAQKREILAWRTFLGV